MVDGTEPTVGSLPVKDSDPQKSQIGLALKELRGKRTQDFFAGLVGINKSTVEKIERGERIPSSKIIFSVCSALSTTE